MKHKNLFVLPVVQEETREEAKETQLAQEHGKNTNNRAKDNTTAEHLPMQSE